MNSAIESFYVTECSLLFSRRPIRRQGSWLSSPTRAHTSWLFPTSNRSLVSERSLGLKWQRVWSRERLSRRRSKSQPTLQRTRDGKQEDDYRYPDSSFRRGHVDQSERKARQLSTRYAVAYIYCITYARLYIFGSSYRFLFKQKNCFDFWPGCWLRSGIQVEHFFWLTVAFGSYSSRRHYTFVW